MKTEFEVKVLDINPGQVQSLLEKLGLGRGDTLKYQRYVYEIQDHPDAWLRLRTDGTTTTLSYKSFVTDKIDGVKELEIIVNDFEATHKLLETLGFQAKSYQENRRTLFTNEDVEISIDEWPLIPPYLEIEAKNKETVNKYIKLLNLDNADKTSKPTSYVYGLHNIDIGSYKRLTFES